MPPRKKKSPEVVEAVEAATPAVATPAVVPEVATPSSPSSPPPPTYEKTFDGLFVVSTTRTLNKKAHGTRTAELIDILPEGYSAARVELTYPGDVQGDGILSLWTSDVTWEEIRNNQGEVVRKVLSADLATRRALSTPRPVLTYHFDATDYPQRVIGVVFHSPAGRMIVNGRPIDQSSVIQIKVICRKTA